LMVRDGSARTLDCPEQPLPILAGCTRRRLLQLAGTRNSCPSPAFRGAFSNRATAIRRAGARWIIMGEQECLLQLIGKFSRSPAFVQVTVEHSRGTSQRVL
jgi:hypothetical protein